MVDPFEPVPTGEAPGSIRPKASPTLATVAEPRVRATPDTETLVEPVPLLHLPRREGPFPVPVQRPEPEDKVGSPAQHYGFSESAM